jgi:hypothetical protein
MKHFSTFIILMSAVSILTTQAQPVLTHDIHALKAGIDNPMSYCEYLDPGSAGANQVWDYSDLKFKKSFTGFLTDSRMSEPGIEFTQANTSLNEFNSLFFFKVSETKIEQYGYSSADGRSQIRYDKPFVKMKYPFAFGDQFSGTFSGNSLNSGVNISTIKGQYAVEADAWGTLILPEGVVYENTLRVRTEKSYTNSSSSREQQLEIITYRWYNEAHRYPLLVLTSYTTMNASGTKNTHYQAAYNNDAVKYNSPIREESIVLYPNPASTEMMVEFDAISAGELHFTIVDQSGRSIREFSYSITAAGVQTFDISEEVADLQPASYILYIESGTKRIQRVFSVVD